jgi:hypothetical protein
MLLASVRAWNNRSTQVIQTMMSGPLCLFPMPPLQASRCASRGFDVLPRPPQIPFRRTVTLRQPNGTTVSVEAIFTTGTSMPIDHPGYDCLLLGIEKADVPMGTEVWVSE